MTGMHRTQSDHPHFGPSVTSYMITCDLTIYHVKFMLTFGYY